MTVLISSVELEDSQLSTPALEEFREDKFVSPWIEILNINMIKEGGEILKCDVLMTTLSVLGLERHKEEPMRLSMDFPDYK